MQTISELNKKLNQLPPEKIEEVKDFIDFLVSHHKQKKKIAKLCGIWGGKGFEKITNLEAEIKVVKKELSQSILKKKI